MEAALDEGTAAAAAVAASLADGARRGTTHAIDFRADEKGN
jgi:hypothetical protein